MWPRVKSIIFTMFVAYVIASSTACDPSRREPPRREPGYRFPPSASTMCDGFNIQVDEVWITERKIEAKFLIKNLSGQKSNSPIAGGAINLDYNYYLRGQTSSALIDAGSEAEQVITYVNEEKTMNPVFERLLSFDLVFETARPGFLSSGRRSCWIELIKWDGNVRVRTN